MAKIIFVHFFVYYTDYMAIVYKRYLIQINEFIN